MADQPATPTPWLDLLGEDIPVVSKSGKKLMLKGLDFVDQSAPAPASPVPNAAGVNVLPASSSQLPASAARPPAVPPPNLPVVEDAVFAPKPVAEAPQPAATRADLGLDQESDLADIKKIEARPASVASTAEEKRELPLLESMVEDAVGGTGVTLADEDIKRRYRMLISLFFRELRDALETKSKFTMPLNSGGMGMSDEESERVIAELGKRNTSYHDALAGKAADDKAGYVAMRTEHVLTAQDKIDQSEKEKGDTAFDKLAERVGMKGDMPSLPDSMMSGSSTGGPASQKTGEPKMIPVTSMDAASAATSEVTVPLKTGLGQQSPGQPPPTPPSPLGTDKAAGGQLPPRSPQAPRAPSTAPMMQPQVQRPTVSDVAMAPRLTGPVEELRSISVVDFRRLSRDPKEATLKIKDKIDLLDDQGFEVKTAGVKAWQDSETNRLYLDILRASLEGKPIPEVISALEDGKKPFLTKQEFDAVMDLNRRLRFG